MTGPAHRVLGDSMVLISGAVRQYPQNSIRIPSCKSLWADAAIHRLRRRKDNRACWGCNGNTVQADDVDSVENLSRLADDIESKALSEWEETCIADIHLRGKGWLQSGAAADWLGSTYHHSAFGCSRYIVSLRRGCVKPQRLLFLTGQDASDGTLGRSPAAFWSRHRDRCTRTSHARAPRRMI